MANDEEGKDSSTRAAHTIDAREATGSKSPQKGGDDPERVGGDIKTRDAGQSGGDAETNEGGGQKTGGSGSSANDDPVRGA
jgi:hypothetical protein